MENKEMIKNLQERIKFLEGIIDLQNETNKKLVDTNKKLLAYLKEKVNFQ